jgi:hypothetical protein
MEMERTFGARREVATLGLSLYVLGLAVGPMTLAPLSEVYFRFYSWKASRLIIGV